MTQTELSIIEKYMSKEEIEDIISQELHQKIRHDLNELHVHNLFSENQKYSNNIFQTFFKEFLLENYKENIIKKAEKEIEKLSIDHLLGHTWDRKESPKAINSLKSMQLINEVLEDLKPDIKKRLIKMFISKDDEELYLMFTEQLGGMMYETFIDNLQSK